jgi:hypothetical protein
MNILRFGLSALAAVCTLWSGAASARDTPSGPGMMRCTAVLGRLSSPEVADRMPVLTWAQGYLSGIASVASAFDGTSDVQVPAYDELRPRIVKLCTAEPSSDLYHVARRLSAGRARDN